MKTPRLHHRHSLPSNRMKNTRLHHRQAVGIIDFQYPVEAAKAEGDSIGERQRAAMPPSVSTMVATL